MPDTETGAKGGPDALSADDVRTLYRELRATAAGRNAAYASARELYRGKHWGTADNPMPDGRRYTLTLNYIRPTVLKTVQLLLGQMPGIQVMPPGTDELAKRQAEAQEALAYSTWEANSAGKVFRRVAHNRALLRRGLIYYWWDPNRERVRFRSVAPDNFYPVYDGEDIVECVIISRRLTRQLRRQYPKLADKIVPDGDGDDVFNEDRWAREVAGGGIDILDPAGSSGSILRDAISGHTTVLDWYDSHGNWRRVMGDATHVQQLGYGTDCVPVIEFPNSVPGDETEPHSEIDDIIDLNIYLNQLISQQGDIIKRYSNPTIIDKQSGQSAQQIRQTIQGEGGVLPIRRDGDIELLNWDGTAPDIANQYARVMQGIYDLSGKPATSYGQVLSNQSGVTTNMSMSPATLTTEEHQGLFGMGLIELNEAIFRLNEKFLKAKTIDLRVSGAKGPAQNAWKYYNTTLTGAQINGWYKNRIKWPSALRTDDPIFVQNEMTKMKGDASNPPAQSQYTTMENLGIEDVEMERDRIKQELEDPRLHPERLQAAVSAAQAFAQGQMPAGVEGLDPAAPAAPIGDSGAALEASGSPHGAKSAGESGSGQGY
jgi:hypothetical protein